MAAAAAGGAGGDRVFSLGDLGVGDPGAQLVVPDRARVLDGGPRVVADGGDRGADAGVHRDGDGEPRALLVVAVDAFLHGVDVDERQHVRAGQQRRLPRQFRQELPARLLQLGYVPPTKIPLFHRRIEAKISQVGART